ncbi:MAG: aldehyde dehydrogenase, partial [Acidimicrobiia bacterium]
MDRDAIDQELTVLAGNRRSWARLPILRKLEYLLSMRRLIGQHAAEWVAKAVAGKGIPPESEWAGEEWISGPYAVLASINAMSATLQALAEGKDALQGAEVRTRGGGQVVVDVFPQTIYDRLLLNGYTAEVWMQPEVTVADLRNHVASFYKQPEPEGVVGVILGAGNVSCIPLLDLLSKMFIEGQVVIVKMNPVNDYLGPVFEKIASELIRDGFVRFAYGGTDVGQ